MDEHGGKLRRMRLRWLGHIVRRDYVGKRVEVIVSGRTLTKISPEIS